MQTDIGHLLEVISDLENGDFTVEAEVSDRVTGLVSDTLNRLIENLSHTLQQVSTTAKTAALSSAQVKNYAENVARDVNDQAQGVTQMLSLTETVWQASQQAIANIEETQSILGAVQQSVYQGQTAINEMNDGIEELQSGSDRMVQRIKTLGEFVSLADQFVLEQNQTAAMTQVLALNASLVAAKAAEQRDPDQFQLIAREFESIANQVQQLAQQTNTGLESLQQRTTKINSVVSDVDREIQGLNHLVSNFTQGVSDSSQAFSEVQARTKEVEVSGQAVEQGNKQIAQAAKLTRITLQDVSKQATRTSDRMQQTLASALEMKTIALNLIEKIKVFSLPEKDVATGEATSPSDSSILLELDLAEDEEDITQLHCASVPQASESDTERELAQPNI
ncbi:MAG: methyl-accepting chemotaxis protein [Acaryochloridaceae cyanobacterium RL_2_7]|nr:methyl-accepting chemotaxis protein [Acaryochloridaceae cyanobacterium RL_2_7]